MGSPPTYAELLRAITLGTARRTLDPSLMEWLDDRGAIDPVADAPEQLLAALGIVERTHRLQLHRAQEVSDSPSLAPPETATPTTTRLARGIQLILEGTYPELLDEGVDLLLERDNYLPPNLLPALLDRATALLGTDEPRARRYLAAAGKRGPWLARQHPEWKVLHPDYDYPAAWRREEQPARQAEVLNGWRRKDPEAARSALAAIWDKQSPRNQEVLLEGLIPGLSAADHGWLLSALEPKRKGVRRALTRLLLLAGEPTVRKDFRSLAREAFAAEKATGSALSPEGKALLQRYGNPKSPVTVRQHLLRVLAPNDWETVTGRTLPDFWRSLPVLELREAGRAVAEHGDTAAREALLRFLIHEEPQQFPREVAAVLTGQLASEDFDQLFDQLLTEREDALRLRGLPRFLALSRRTAWNDRLSRAMVRRLLDDLHSRQLDYTTQRDLALHWKQAAPLLDPDIFAWLRQQLHSSTERPDVFGKLATQLLQVTSFRRQLRQA